MMEVQRFEYKPGVFSVALKDFKPGMNPIDTGDWVQYADYSKLRADLEAVTNERDRLANPIEHADYFAGTVINLEQQLSTVTKERNKLGRQLAQVLKEHEGMKEEIINLSADTLILATHVYTEDGVFCMDNGEMYDTAKGVSYETMQQQLAQSQARVQELEEERSAYYQAVVTVLHGAGRLLTEKSAIDQLVQYGHDAETEKAFLHTRRGELVIERDRAQARVQALEVGLRNYLAGRRASIEASIAVERLAGNGAKLAIEEHCLIEIAAMQYEFILQPAALTPTPDASKGAK